MDYFCPLCKQLMTGKMLSSITKCYNCNVIVEFSITPINKSNTKFTNTQLEEYV